MSKDGLTIDPERVEAILSLSLLAHKKGLQSFLGRINFVRIFIPNLAALVKPLTTMLKKDVVFTWTKEAKVNFEEIKKEIAPDPTLVNPKFDRDFLLYSLGKDSSISVVLTQQTDEGME